MEKFVREMSIYHIVSDNELIDKFGGLPSGTNSDLYWPKFLLGGEILVDSFHFLYPSVIFFIEIVDFMPYLLYWSEIDT